MKNSIGVNKEIDSLGRLVIPKEMRDLFQINKNVELVVTENGVLVRNPKYRLVKIDEEKKDNDKI
jgi:bifunctional DNA-binding transcriptional regulator/antitoxin component of YhaV-PrlF toxin-antitoxin module